MKKIIILLFLLLGFISNMLYAQVRVNGGVNSSLYAWEDFNENQRYDFHQGIRLKVAPEKNPYLYFKTYSRFAYRGDPAEWDEKIYNGYVNWASPVGNYNIKIGRQFVYAGVLNGTFDALQLQFKPMKKLNIRFLGGLYAPYSRQAELLKWDEGNALGGYLDYNFSALAKFNISYLQKSNDSETVWQQAGTSLSGKLKEDLFYFTEFHYDIKNSSYQGIRARLSYYLDKWTLSTEYNSQRPRIYEDSFFRIFEISAYSQIRTAANYQLGNYNLGLTYLYTMFEDQNNNQVNFSVAFQWGFAGLILQDGDRGKNTGFYGGIDYDLLPKLTVQLSSSYLNYQRQAVEITEEATAFSAGLKYSVSHDLKFNVNVQEGINSHFKNDLRVLTRMQYKFDL